MSLCHAQGIFSTTPDRCTWSSPGTLVLSILFTYFLPTWLPWAFGLLLRSPSLDHRTLPCESQNTGEPHCMTLRM